MSPDGDAAATTTEPESMGIDPYEKNWMRFSVLLLVAFAATIAIGGLAMGFEVPGPEQEVDPRTVLDEPPWSQPGLREVAPGVFEAYVVAQTWAFVPRELVLPLGAEVTIYVTSPDVQHGFRLDESNINMQVIPGQVSKLTYEFEDLGEFPYICHEYCGIGHAAMFGTVKVVTQAEYDALDSEGAESEGDGA